jgi:hypothetical protein
LDFDGLNRAGRNALSAKKCTICAASLLLRLYKRHFIAFCNSGTGTIVPLCGVDGKRTPIEIAPDGWHEDERFRSRDAIKGDGRSATARA